MWPPPFKLTTDHAAHDRFLLWCAVGTCMFWLRSTNNLCLSYTRDVILHICWFVPLSYPFILFSAIHRLQVFQRIWLPTRRHWPIPSSEAPAAAECRSFSGKRIRIYHVRTLRPFYFRRTFLVFMLGSEMSLYFPPLPFTTCDSHRTLQPYIYIHNHIYVHIQL